MARQEIGSGGYGRVYKPGFDCLNYPGIDLSSDYISKVMHPATATEELKVYNDLRLHQLPNVDTYAILNPIDCVIQDMNNNVKVLNYRYGGKSLEEILKHHPSPAVIHDLLKKFDTLLTGVLTMNAANRYHLDIKPDNIVVDASGQLRLIDFGLSLHIPDITQFRLSAHYNANYIFWPPEIHLLANNPTLIPSSEYHKYKIYPVIRGVLVIPTIEEVLKTADVWGLGATLHFIYLKLKDGDPIKKLLKERVLGPIFTYDYASRLKAGDLKEVYEMFILEAFYA